MQLHRILVICISCSIVSAQRNIERLLRRQHELTFDDYFDIQQRGLADGLVDSLNVESHLYPRYAGLLDDLDFESHLLRRNLFQVLRDMHKKDKKKPATGGRDTNSESSSGGGDMPKKDDSTDSEHEENESEANSQEAENKAISCEADDDNNTGEESG